MKPLIFGLIALVLANTGFASSLIDAAVSFDGVALGALSLIGFVCLVIARNRTV